MKCWGFYKLDLAAAATTGHFNELINIFFFLKERCWFIVFLRLVATAGVAKRGEVGAGKLFHFYLNINAHICVLYTCCLHMCKDVPNP